MNARAVLQELYNRGVEVMLIDDGVKLRRVELLTADELDYLRKMKSDIIAELKSVASCVIQKSCCICGDVHAPFGVMYSWRDPDTARWYCPDHYKKDC